MSAKRFSVTTNVPVGYGVMTEDEVIEEIVRIEREAVEYGRGLVTPEALREAVRTRISSAIDRIVTEAIGVSAKWGRFEVDHCNARQVAIANELGTYAMQFVRDAIPAAMERLFPGGKVPEEWLAPLAADLKNKFDYEVRKGLEEAAKRLAAEHVARVAERLKQKINEKYDAVEMLRDGK